MSNFDSDPLACDHVLFPTSSLNSAKMNCVFPGRGKRYDLDFGMDSPMVEISCIIPIFIDFGNLQGTMGVPSWTKSENF